MLVHQAEPWLGKTIVILTYSPGWMLIGTCRGKHSPTHIISDIRWIQALGLYKGKSTIFCGSSVALTPKLPDVQAKKSDQEAYGVHSRP